MDFQNANTHTSMLVNLTAHMKGGFYHRA